MLFAFSAFGLPCFLLFPLLLPLQFFVAEHLCGKNFFAIKTTFFKQLVELDVHREIVAVLRVLDDEDHKKRNDCRARVDDELPRFGKFEQRPRRCPEDDDRECCRKDPRPPQDLGSLRRKPRKDVLLFLRCHHVLL